MITIDHLTKYYGDHCAVDRVHFEIHSGEVLGLLGPNGAGKTTTMRILTGYLAPSGGDIRVKGISVRESPFAVKQLIGYLPESAPLPPDMLVFDYLTYVAGIRGLNRTEANRRLDELAATCSIGEVMHQPIGELSKGYRQRVGLAQAMMGDSEILVLDEPTSGLDPNQITEIRDIIRQIGKEKTVILSTHILSEAEATCDRVVIIHHGRIAADGPIETLRQTLGREETLFLTLAEAAAEPAKALLSTVSGITSVTTEPDGSGVLAVRLTCAPGTDPRASVYSAIKSTHWPLLEFRREVQSLESIFRELTKES